MEPGWCLTAFSATLAVRFCEMESPALVIIKEHIRDCVFDELHDDLRNSDPNFPFIEILNQV